MYLSEQDRRDLLHALQKAIPGLENPELRSIFTLMVALLHDHQELIRVRKMEAENYLNHLKWIEGNLRKLAENMDETAPPDAALWQ